jgi:hypothetical protein
LTCPLYLAPCPPLPEMLAYKMHAVCGAGRRVPAHKLNAISGVGRRVAGGCKVVVIRISSPEADESLRAGLSETSVRDIGLFILDKNGGTPHHV